MVTSRKNLHAFDRLFTRRSQYKNDDKNQMTFWMRKTNDRCGPHGAETPPPGERDGRRHVARNANICQAPPCSPRAARRTIKATTPGAPSARPVQGGCSMQYGHFDNDRREYVIDRVDLPASWTNYLGTEEMCAVVNDFHSKTNFLPLAEIPVYLRLCN